MAPRLILQQRQYTAPPELARQLQQRDRELEALLRRFALTLETAEGSSSTSRLALIWFFPEDYGAVHDGVTDDTSALQQCIVAAQATGGTVMLSPFRYRITNTLLISAAVSIVGQTGSEIAIKSSNRTAIRITGDGVELHNFTVRGDQTGTGGAASGNTGGNGVAVHNASETLLEDMRFEDIGLPLGTAVHGDHATAVKMLGSENTLIIRGYFAPSVHSRTGSDVEINGIGSAVLYCFSESESDAFVAISAGDERVMHKIHGNIAVREAELSRSAVLLNYGGGDPVYATVTENDLAGFRWHGIYSPTLIEAGRIVASHNLIRNCGGGNGPSGDPWPGAGVRIQGTGLVFDGNIINDTGYQADGTPRPNIAAGIFIYNNASEHTYSRNIISRSTGASILMDAVATLEAISDVDILDNVCSEAGADAGIDLKAQVGSTECITGVRILRNRVDISVAGLNGIWAHANNGSWFDGVNIDDNRVEYTGASPSTGTGIHRLGYTGGYTRFRGSLSRNSVKGFATGAQLSGAVPTLYSPHAVAMRDNMFTNCTLGIDSAGVQFQLHSGTVFQNCTTNTVNNLRVGDLVNNTGVRFESDQQPTLGTWLVGDRCDLPTFRGPITGFRCATAGTPGLWVPIWEDVGFGSDGWVAAEFDTTDLRSRAVNGGIVAGTATARTFASTSVYTRTPFLEALDTVASTSAVAGVRSDSLCISRGAPFYVRIIWAPATGMSVSTRRAFCGMCASTAAPTDVDPSSLTDIIGMGWDDTDTQVQFIYSNTTGPATKVALGASFPRPSADRTLVYALDIFQSGPSAVTRIFATELSTGVRSAELFAAQANLPTVPLVPFHLYSSVGGTSGVAGVAFRECKIWRAQ